jgi:hypothetical protein
MPWASQVSYMTQYYVVWSVRIKNCILLQTGLKVEGYGVSNNAVTVAKLCGSSAYSGSLKRTVINSVKYATTNKTVTSEMIEH